MTRKVKENTDPKATTTYKTCRKCKESKLLLDFPFTYKKYKNENHIGYKSKCRVCECEQQKEIYKKYREIKELNKALTIKFDADDHPEVKDGALINIENVDANSEK